MPCDEREEDLKRDLNDYNACVTVVVVVVEEEEEEDDDDDDGSEALSLHEDDNWQR